MLQLVFAEASLSSTVDVGPLPEVRIDGETSATRVTARFSGRHERHQWRVGGRDFFRVDCSCLVRPFLHFSCADGIAYGDGDICANIDLESKKWYCHRDEKYWQSLVVKSAAAPAA